MKKIFAILSLAAFLTACHDSPPPQAYQQPQYQQPVVVQQAPAQAPVVVQQQDNSGTAMVAGAALGAVAAMALSDRDRGYQAGYNQPPAIQQQVTHVTQVNKTVIVNNHGPNDKNPPSAPTATAPTPAPNAPAPSGVNLTKPSYAVAGTANPVPTMSPAALTAPKTLTMAAVPAPANAYKPANVAAVSYRQAPALPAPSRPLALPAPRPSPKPAASSYTYRAAPKMSSVSYKPYGRK